MVWMVSMLVVGTDDRSQCSKQKHPIHLHQHRDIYSPYVSAKEHPGEVALPSTKSKPSLGLAVERDTSAIAARFGRRFQRPVQPTSGSRDRAATLSTEYSALRTALDLSASSTCPLCTPVERCPLTARSRPPSAQLPRLASLCSHGLLRATRVAMRKTVRFLDLQVPRPSTAIALPKSPFPYPITFPHACLDDLDFPSRPASPSVQFGPSDQAAPRNPRRSPCGTRDWRVAQDQYQNRDQDRDRSGRRPNGQFWRSFLRPTKKRLFVVLASPCDTSGDHRTLQTYRVGGEGSGEVLWLIRRRS